MTRLLNQNRFRIASCQGLLDNLENQAERLNVQIGSLYILPSTFVGGVRYMRQTYQDAMAIVRKCGKPDLFITFRANPQWDEIVNELNGAPYTYRPDICVRVFYCKFNEFLRDIVDCQIFWQVVSYVAVVEFQMRGLPHAHILITLSESDKISSSEQIDQIIWAEIPDPIKFAELHKIVLKNMRNKCDRRCLNEKARFKSYFPKPHSDETIIIKNGITRYKRREHPRIVLPNVQVVTNQQVILYNP